jgi:serine/threonine protein kinase/Tfp pilus assembly protein PilF
MKCLKCKTVNPDDNLYCGRCGSSLIDIPEPFTTTVTKNNLREQTLDFVPGEFFGERYQIIEEIGRGGMGRVYKAIDKELNRIVVLKMIRPERSSDPGMVKRFKKEINLASQITHENVCRIYDLGEIDGIKYISMQFIDGENLKDFIQTSKRLSIETTIDITRQICQALIAAHKKGVIHRDLKPKNIMLDKKGTAFVMDFGIAKSIDSEDTIRPGAIVGTPYYMSPEQAVGERIDHRSDIYSLGAIMYEMLAGKPPFKADTIAGLIHKHVNETPKPISQLNPQTPVELEKITMKCLEKKPDKRYQGADDIIAALNKAEAEAIISARPARIHLKKIAPLAAIVLAILAFIISYLIIVEKGSVQTANSKKIHSIAVMPFKDLSPQKNQEHFCEGMTDDVITKIRIMIPDLKVFPMSSGMGSKDIKRIGQEFGVDSLLQPSIQKEKNRIRVNAQLICVEDGFLLWSATYDRKLEGTFKVQDEISRAIAQALKVELVSDSLDLIKSREPKNVEAYDYYRKGMNFLDKKYDLYYREEDFKTAVNMFKRAIEIEPDYALAYWGLGSTYESHYVKIRNKEDLNQALKYLEMSYELDPNLAEANLAMGWAYFYKVNNDKAYKYFKRALEINPNSATVNLYAGSFFRSIGLYRRAIKCFSKSIERDPLDIMTYMLITDCSICTGEFEKAAFYVKKGLELEPNNVPLRIYHAQYFLWLKKYKEAEKVLNKVEKIEPENPSIKRYQALLLAAKGKKMEALALINDTAPYRYEVTSIYSLLGLKEKAITYINEGIAKGFEYRLMYLYSYPYLINNPCYDNLHDDPRFQEIVNQEKEKYETKVKKYGDL